MNQKLKDKGLELHEWYDKQFKVLLRQQEALLMTREAVMAREARLVDRKACREARAQASSRRAEKLELPSMPKMMI